VLADGILEDAQDTAAVAFHLFGQALRLAGELLLRVGSPGWHRSAQVVQVWGVPPPVLFGGPLGRVLRGADLRRRRVARQETGRAATNLGLTPGKRGQKQ